ncbi:uncharacterized protein BO97DRAFT_405866 [Aspergillus homomorphus CBS 101889]|uniref:Tetraspanin Tsp3 n=1 Tax=Aspergillus homomorphus (strain CBS 101889) TaxID=1450537 RepID=A0A395HWA4_ASPHC|nr:hypothetical protein BO97DRAFT_405866 [Aspergillus homomorphus CBS 101889]RAL11809.1 hypothetical protein BO97DRAFT_405866 [Aspergillus homomorphus CBS 101889]
MPIKFNSVFFIHLLITITSILAFVIAVISWTRTNTFSLPVPLSLPILTTLLIPFTLIALPLTVFLAKSTRPKVTLLAPILNTLHTVLSTLLLTIALIYLSRSSPINACTLDQTWQAFFHARNAPAIRTIQDRLQCCGLRSIHDRAWPFKDRTHDDKACAVQMGYTRPCLGPWRAEEIGVLWMVVVVVVLMGGLKVAFWFFRVRGMGANWDAKHDDAAQQQRNEYEPIRDREIEEGGVEEAEVGGGDAAGTTGRLLPHSESGYVWRQS